MLSPEIQAQATIKSCAVFEDDIVAMLKLEAAKTLSDFTSKIYMSHDSLTLS